MDSPFRSDIQHLITLFFDGLGKSYQEDV